MKELLRKNDNHCKKLLLSDDDGAMNSGSCGYYDHSALGEAHAFTRERAASFL